MNQLSKRQKNILKKLIESSIPLKTDEIRGYLDISTRTLRYDIQDIRSYLENFSIKLINKKGKGYFLTPVDKQKLLQHISSKELSSKTILLKILLSILIKNSTYIELEQKISYSKSHLKSHVKELQKVVNIALDNENRIFINEDEEVLRKKVYKFINENFNNQELTQTLSSLNLLETYKNTISCLQTYIRIYNVWISTGAFRNLKLFVFISYLRISSYKFIEDKKLYLKEFEKEYEFANKIINHLCGNNIEKSEITLLLLFIISNGIFIHDEFNSSIKLNIAIKNMMNELKKNKKYKFEYTNLEIDIRRHLSQFLKRYSTEINLVSEQALSHIKNQYADYYKIAENLFSIFSKDFEIKYIENEINYLAIYLYKNRIEKTNKTYKVLTVCGTGHGLSALIKSRIENNFKNIKIVKSVSSFEVLSQFELSEIDFIISTVKLNIKDVKIINVSSLITRDDIIEIENYLNYGASYEAIPFVHDFEFINNGNLIHDISCNYSKMILKLYDLILELPPNYKVNSETILGVTMHLIIALPRLLETPKFQDKELDLEVITIENNHPILKRVLHDFFNYIQVLFPVLMTSQEKYAFYQYFLMEYKND